MLDAGAIGNNDAFLRAYALYRLNREDAARDALAAIKEDKGEDKAIQYLEAQLVGVLGHSLNMHFIFFPELPRGLLPGSF